MSKDKQLGLITTLVGGFLILFYTFWAPLSLILEGPTLEPDNIEYPFLRSLYSIPGMDWTWAVVMPLWLIILLIGIIAIWIGFSMLTTPPPVPLEELKDELVAEDVASKGAENNEKMK